MVMGGGVKQKPRNQKAPIKKKTQDKKNEKEVSSSFAHNF